MTISIVKNWLNRIAWTALAGACLPLLWGCEQPRPRSFSEYLDDPIAREATLARCNTDRAASFDDLECKNARRAAAALAAQAEAERRTRLEEESERKRAAARERIAAQQDAARRAAEAARQAAEAAYEEQLLYGGTKLENVVPPSTDGEVEPGAALPQTMGSEGLQPFEQPAEQAPSMADPEPQAELTRMPDPG